MSPTEPVLDPLPPVHLARLAHSDAVNPAIRAAFRREKEGSEVRQTHHFDGRFENTYIDRSRVPEIAPVVELARRCAQGLLGLQALHLGFWFNEMRPGERTSLHSHEELDELLSAVYYVDAPPESGRLILHDAPATIVITPEPGLLVLFPPDVPHEVEHNASRSTRLSIAFNFGPSSAVN